MPRNKENDAKTCVRVFQEKKKEKGNTCQTMSRTKYKNGKDGRKDKLYLKHTSCLNHNFTAFTAFYYLSPLLGFLKVTTKDCTTFF